MVPFQSSFKMEWILPEDRPSIPWRFLESLGLRCVHTKNVTLAVGLRSGCHLTPMWLPDRFLYVYTKALSSMESPCILPR